MIINHNISALNTLNKFNRSNNKSTDAIERLSSGLKIYKAGDDAAGLAISEKMRGQIRGLNMAEKNIQDGVSLIQTAEGAMNEIQSLLQRGRELSVQAGNDTNTIGDRLKIQEEINEIRKEISSIANKTEFNTKKLLNGSFSYQSKPITPQSGLKATGTGQSSITVNDGWVNFGTDSPPLHKVKLNAGEQVVDDPSNWLFTQLSISVNYNSNGTPRSMDIHSIPESYIIVNKHPQLTYSYNGITIDVSDKIINTNSGGHQHQGTISLTDGNNDGSINNDIDNSLVLQTGANAEQNMKIQIANISSASLGVNAVSVLNNSSAENAITTFDKAINFVSSERSKLGAYQNRLEHTYSTVINTSENLQSAESRIRDTDIAKEMLIFTKNNILTQASQVMLAQANQSTSGVIQLLK